MKNFFTKPKIILLFLSFISYFLFLNFYSYAQTPTDEPTEAPSPTPTKTENKLEKNFVNKVASIVAKLDLVEKKGLIGTVNSVDNTQLTITDLGNETNFIDVDEITEFASPSAQESYGISDLTKGAKIAILGLYNKQSRRTLARFIEITVLPKTIHGSIISKDVGEFTIDVFSDDGNAYTADIESSTKTFVYKKGTGILRSGFSKLENNQRVILRGFPVKTDPKRITTTRILILPEIPKNPKLDFLQIPTEVPLASPSPTIKTIR